MLSRTKTRNTTTSDTTNSGPTKLCRFFSAYESQPNSVLPMTGSRKNLPKAITMPEIASATNAIAFVQCAARSK